jgi:hypothetical protein
MHKTERTEERERKIPKRKVFSEKSFEILKEMGSFDTHARRSTAAGHF